MTIAIGYVRQSRETQSMSSPEAQRGAIERYAESQGWRLIDVLSDLGKSGFDPKVKRPALNEVLALVERGGINRVIVWKLDRLTRRGIREALELVERIENAGAALVSVTEPFDTSSALGQGIFALLLSLASAESEKLGERVRSGKTVVRRRGGWMGGPVPYGFDVERVDDAGYTRSRLVLDPVTAPTLRSIVSDALDGRSARSIIKRLNAEGVPSARGGEWSHAAVLGILRNPVLAGYLPDGRGDVLRDEDGQPAVYGDAVIGADGWRQLQERVVVRSGRRPARPSLLGGIAICAGCGTTMGGESTGRHPSYRCCRSSSGRNCDAPALVPMPATDDYVLRALTRELRAAIEDYIARGEVERGPLLERVARWWALRDGARDVSAVIRERDEVDDALGRLREAFVAGDFSDDPGQYRTLHERLSARREALSADLDTELPLPDVVASQDFLEDLDLGTKRELIRLLLRVECVKAGRPGIRFEPDQRLRLTLILDWDLLLRVAGHADDA